MPGALLAASTAPEPAEPRQPQRCGTAGFCGSRESKLPEKSKTHRPPGATFIHKGDLFFFDNYRRKYILF